MKSTVQDGKITAKLTKNQQDTSDTVQETSKIK
jgi:hypothetical protein